MQENEVEQRLETIFSSILDALRGVWDVTNAANVLLSLIFYKRLFSLVDDGTMPFIKINTEDRELVSSFRAELMQDKKKAVRDLSLALIQISKNNPSLKNIFAPLIFAFEQEEDTRHLVQVILMLDEFDLSEENFSTETFGAFFNTSLNRAAIRAGKTGGKWTTPKSLNELLAALIAPKSGERVYDPCAGQGSTYIELNKLCPDLQFVGQEQNLNVWALCKMNLMVNGIYNSEVEHENSLTTTIENEEVGKIDIAVANFPFGQYIKPQYIKYQPYVSIPFDVNMLKVNCNTLFVQLMLHRLKEDGRMFVILPINSMFKDREERKLREYLVRRDLVEAVIALPYGMLYSTGAPVCILVLNKQKSIERKEHILFINGANLTVNGKSKLNRELNEEQIQCLAAIFHETNANCSEELNDCVTLMPLHNIILNNYNLNPKRYASPFIRELHRLETRNRLVAIHTLIKEDTPAMWFDKNHAPHTNLPYVMADCLGTSLSNYWLIPNRLKTTDEYSSVVGKMVSESVLLVNREGADLRVSYFDYNYNGQPIIVDEGVMTFRIDLTKISIEYLLLQMYDKLFLQQLQMYKSDHQDQLISEKEFGQLQIVFPHKQIQEGIVKERKLQLLIEEEKKVEELRHRLNLGRQRAQSEQYKIISSLQHELGNRLPAVLTEFKNLKDYLHDKEEDGTKISMNEPIFPIFEDEDPADVDTLEIAVNRIELMLGYAISTVDAASNIVQADRSRFHLTYENLKEILEEVKQLYISEAKFTIQIEVEEDENGNELDISTYIDKAQLTTAISNLIENARRHGFIDRKKYLIRFRISLSSDEKEVILDCKNDGRPFPSSFSFDDFISYGNYAGETGHSGIGGFLINQIIENHDGNLAYREDIDSRDPFKVQFEITLPNLKK